MKAKTEKGGARNGVHTRRKWLVNIQTIYDSMPLIERALLRAKECGLFPAVRNDRGKPCEYWIYAGDHPVGVVVYYKGRKLCLRSYKEEAD